MQKQQQQHRNQLRLSRLFTKFFLLFNELRKFYHIFAAASNLSQRFSFLSLSLSFSLSRFQFNLHTHSEHYFYLPDSALIYDFITGSEKKKSNAERRVENPN